ncbi:MAG: hypothetical protein A2622_00490 [Bdellovibrionales bacterium RIFCSPHIGHO2_01_FULL_40_29]|nr:MAG: hypothetical protein A2622_00490 [Bdellovibrionales bacterium RIFCSPHIGHO2_01_FULL_40_29]OFZ32601.1 MAG: hypothetical protein A3D17_05090 [Bdellovibrionales bacterium RIFCSPHIGHO2_02_FULL_40_15]
MTISKIILIISVLLPSVIFANAKVIGNGGDPLVFDFIHSARSALIKVNKNTDLAQSIPLFELSRQIQKTRIIISNEPLFVSVEGIQQQSVAVNYHHPDRIVLHRSAWLAIQDSSAKEALALHEYLSLLGLESSGRYDISKNLTASCYGPQLARDAIRALALISNRSQISDLVGGCQKTTCKIAANYRQAQYADLYHVTYDEIQCRVTTLTLVTSGMPVQDPI